MKHKLLIMEEKGYSFRLLDIDDQTKYRALKKNFNTMAVGGLLLVEDLTVTGDLIEEMSILFTVKGDTAKARVEIPAEKAKLGQLIDGVPILRIGKPFYKHGEKRVYAYFYDF